MSLREEIMSNILPISQLPAGNAPTGAEEIPVTQAGSTVRLTADQILALVTLAGLGGVTLAQVETAINQGYVGAQLWPESAAETAAATPPINFAIPSDAGLIRSSRYSATNSWDYRKDQRQFEIYLSKYGAVFNGASDDGPALSNTFAAMAALGGSRRRVIMPSGGLTAKINSGFTLYTGGIGVDFNGLKIDASGMASGVAMTLDGLGGQAAYNPEVTVCPIENLYLLGPSAASTMTGISINGATAPISGLMLRNVRVIGGNVGIQLGENQWLTTLLNCMTHAQTQYGIYASLATTAGESIAMHGGAIGNVTNAGKTGIGLYLPQPAANSNNMLALTLVGVSIDFCDQLIYHQNGDLQLFGCELNTSSTVNPAVYIAKPTTGPRTHFVMKGGAVIPSTVTYPPVLFELAGDSNCTADIDTDIQTFNVPTQILNVTGASPAKLATRGIYFGGTNVSLYPTIGPQIAQNYNGGFETGATTGWQSVGTGITFSAQSGTVHSGTYAGEIVGATAAGQVQFLCPCAAGESVILDNWINVSAASAGSVDAEVDFYDQNGDKISSVTIATWITATSGWVRNALQTAAPAGTASAYFKINMVGFTGTVYIDDTYMHIGG
jgi:hypothetical protein